MRLDPRMTPARPSSPRSICRAGRSRALRRRRAPRGRRAAGAAAPCALPRCPARHRGAQGRARHGLRDHRRRLGLGPARDRRLCRLPARECAWPARSRADPQGRGAAHARFPGPSIKLPPIEALPLGARLAVARIEAPFAITASGGYVPARHLAPLDATESDFVAVAERFLGTPYLWGGKTSLGLDCSGLVQVALDGLRGRLPARQRHAGTGAGQAARLRDRSLRVCGAAICCSGKAMSPSCGTRRR